MHDWKHEIRQRLARLKLAPTREAAIVEEPAQHLDDYYSELLASGVTEAEAERRTLAELSESEFLARGVASFACWIPVWRAAKVAPLAALRCE